MSNPNRNEPKELAAWRDFCHRIEALGEQILQPPYPSTPEDGPEAIAHLADQVSCWLGYATGHFDTTAPFFHRSNDLVTQWGGPNQDNAYRHARIDPRRRYRIRGRMNSCEEFALTLRIDFMHMPEWGTRATITASDRGIGPGDSFEILLGGDGSDPAWTPIPDEVTTVSLREYYVDWQPLEPATFTIECLDDVEPPPRVDGNTVVQRLETALTQTERSMTYWNEYMREHRAAGTDNQFALPMKLAKGLGAARYAFCFFELAPDEALYIESDVPDARYWSLQLANMGWFEQIDPIHRITTINQKQAYLGGDGPSAPGARPRRSGRPKLAGHRWPSRRTPDIPLVLAEFGPEPNDPRRQARRDRRAPAAGHAVRRRRDPSRGDPPAEATPGLAIPIVSAARRRSGDGR